MEWSDVSDVFQFALMRVSSSRDEAVVALTVDEIVSIRADASELLEVAENAAATLTKGVSIRADASELLEVVSWSFTGVLAAAGFQFALMRVSSSRQAFGEFCLLDNTVSIRADASDLLEVTKKTEYKQLRVVSIRADASELLEAQSLTRAWKNGWRFQFALMRVSSSRRDAKNAMKVEVIVSIRADASELLEVHGEQRNNECLI